VQPTVLVADEDVNFQIIVDTLLTLRGFQVRRASDAAEAEALVRQEPVAVVVLGQGLPGMNGFDFLRRLSGRSKPLPLPTQPRLVVITSHGAHPFDRFALHLGADAVLHKPFAPGDFIHTIEQLAGNAAPQAA
jgi:DNA-binding response OmpR family regulator